MNARRQAVRDQILRTAADLFRERGYRASTLDDIARRLGMSKTSLYGHFRAKEEMLGAPRSAQAVFRPSYSSCESRNTTIRSRRFRIAI